MVVLRGGAVSYERGTIVLVAWRKYAETFLAVLK
jgi:hypothetical protein